MMTMELLWLAMILDLLFGDPPWLPHPTRGVAWFCMRGEKVIRTLSTSPFGLKLGGTMLVITITGMSYMVTVVLMTLAELMPPVLAIFIKAWVLSSSFAVRGLAEAGRAVKDFLDRNDTVAARQALSMVVGRDTEDLPEQEIIRGAVETVAENTVDAVVAPLFYALLGGVPLAMAYRAVNTMDALIGYKNAKYINFGWAAARLDDVMNYLPARLTGCFMVLGAFIFRMDWRRGLATWRKYAALHPSPNSGVPESVVAGVLGIRLGGVNYYQGLPSNRPTMGEALFPLACTHIQKTINLMYFCGIITVLGASLFIGLVSR